MRGLLATVLMLGGVLLLGACTEEQEAQDEPTATGTPAATAAATKTPTMTPAEAATSSTPSRGFVQRPTMPTLQPTATAAPAQTVVSQPTVVTQPTVVPQPTVVSQTTVVSQLTTVPQPTVVPTTTPPPTVVATVVPTPVHTPTPPPAATPMPTPTPPPPLPPTSIACPEPGSFSGIGQTTGGGDFGFDVVGGCGISRVWSYNEWAVCDDGTEANPDLVEIIYDQPLSIANGTFSDEGTECSAGPEGSWWCSTLRFAGQFTSDSMAKGGFDMQIEITGWAGADTVHCYLDDLNWRAFRE